MIFKMIEKIVWHYSPKGFRKNKKKIIKQNIKWSQSNFWHFLKLAVVFPVLFTISWLESSVWVQKMTLIDKSINYRIQVQIERIKIDFSFTFMT